MNPETVAYESLGIGDMRFAYHRAGHGRVPIILLHGWPQTCWAWRRVTPRLSPVCDVVVPDLPGFGYSSKPEGGFDKKTVAASQWPPAVFGPRPAAGVSRQG